MSINVSNYSGTIGSLTVTGALRTSATSIALGSSSGATSQSSGAVAVGQSSGNSGQGVNAIAVGNTAAATSQQTNSIAVGTQAAQISQQSQAIALGYQSGMTSQSIQSISIGSLAGKSSLGRQATAVGYLAASGVVSPAGANSLCLGAYAGSNSCPANCIVINSTSSDFSPATAGFFVNGLRSRTVGVSGLTAGALGYDSTTKEIYYVIP